MSRKYLYVIPAATAIVTAAVGTALLTGSAAPAPAKAQVAQQPPVVVEGPVSAPGGDTYATCPAGTQLAGGGYNSVTFARTGIGDAADALTANTPSTIIPNTWGAKLLKGTLRAYAMCVTTSSTPPVVVAGPVSAPGGTSRATCPAGTVLAGAGYTATPVINGYGANVDSEILSAPSTTVPNSWTFRWLRGTVQSRVLCTP
ncbi:MAG: hypothetical protein JO345_41295 [Streptosporangiaceae bacterium]|nr:hypothetical protein [Streptosporangiaceae bacterium]